MSKLFNNPLEVKETDSFGTSVLKSMTTNYVKGTLAAGAGLGVLAIMGWVISKKVESDKEEEEEMTEEEALEQFYEELDEELKDIRELEKREENFKV